MKREEVKGKLIYKSSFSGKETNFGFIGETSCKLTYEDGTYVQVGDVVKILHEKQIDDSELSFIVKIDDSLFIMGLCGSSYKLRLGKINDYTTYTIKLVKKYTELVDGESYRDITAHVETKTKKENNKMEKKMTKAELEGKWFKCTYSEDVTEYEVGDMFKCSNKSFGKINILFSWYTELPETFTISELNQVLQNSYRGVRFKYIGDNPSQSTKKSTPKEIKVKISADLVFDKPVVEETKEEVFIFAGRTTIYFSKEFGEFGIATVNSDELKSYSKEIGMSLAFRRCYLKIDGGK